MIDRYFIYFQKRLLKTYGRKRFLGKRQAMLHYKIQLLKRPDLVQHKRDRLQGETE